MALSLMDRGSREAGRILEKLWRRMKESQFGPAVDQPQPVEPAPSIVRSAENDSGIITNATIEAAAPEATDEADAAFATEQEVMRRAEELRRNGNGEAALELLKSRIAEGPASAGPALTAARMLTDMGQYADAELVLEHAQQQFPADPWTFIDHARIAEAKRDWATMAERYQIVRERFPENDLGYGGGAHASRELGRFDEAEALLEFAQGRRPDHAAFFIDHALVAEWRRDWREMDLRYAGVRERFPEEWWGYAGGATALRHLGRTDEAGSLLELGQKRLPNEPALYIDHARLAEFAGDWPAMAERAEIVRARFPDHPWGHVGKAIALRGLNRFADAEAILEEAKQPFPADRDIAVESARSALVREAWQDAHGRCGDVRARYPDEWWAYAGDAHSLDMLGRERDAAAVLEKALEVSPASADVYGAYCWMAQDARDWPRAAERWKAYRSRFPDRPIGYWAASIALRHAEQFEEADTLAAEGLRAHPGNPELMANHAYVASSRNDWPEAINRWKQYRELFPEDVAGYVQLGIAYTGAHEYASADQSIQEGLTKFPGHIELIGNYAWNAYHQRDWNEALARWEDYKKRFPLDPLGNYQTLLILQELGRFDEVEQLSKAQQPTPETSS